MTERTIGLVGYGKIGTSLHERIASSDDLRVSYVYSRGRVDPVVDDGAAVVDRASVAERDVDLVVEAATREAVASLGPELLETSDLLALSTTALADRSVFETLTDACTEHGTRLYVPHGAVLGTDGLQDAREALDEVRIETRKNPSNIDFSASDVDEPIESETVLYSGPTRGICAEFPRNVNSHATVAVAGIGFDDTKSTLIADPAATEATHRITATGEGTSLQVERASSIEGVTGEYTLSSVWGSVRRAARDDSGTVVL